MQFAGEKMKVMFAIPAYRGIQCPAFVGSLARTIELFKTNGIEHEIEIYGGCYYVQVARNELADRFLKSDCDKLFFLDDDISWDPQGALAVVLSGWSLAGGVYPKKYSDGTSIPFPVVLKCSEEGIPLCDGGYLRSTRTVGGFTCVDRSVFETIKTAYPHLYYKQSQAMELDKFEDRFDFFPQGVAGGRWVGEDYAFCDLWTALGEEIAILPNITFGHHKGDQAWYGNLWRYIKQLPGGVDYENGEAEKALWTDGADARSEGQEKEARVDGNVP
jgi:hypothetical protein